MTIHRDTNYIEFIAKVNTTGTNAGGKYEAFKGDYGWRLYDNYTDTLYQCPMGILREIIGEIIVQAPVKYTLEQKLRLGL